MLPLVVLTFLIVFTNNLGAWRRDWRMGKRTLAVQLSAPRAFDLAGGLTWSAYLALLLVTILSRLPLWSLIGLGTLPLALGIAIAVTLKAPKEAPGARDYHKARLRAYGGYAHG